MTSVSHNGCTATVLVGDALRNLAMLPDGYAKMCVTSPPYFGLRDYGVDGQIGLEETPEEFIAALVAVFREVRRVLANDGTLWVNIGDSYAGKGGHGGQGGVQFAERMRGQKLITKAARYTGGDCKEKDLIGIPWMLAFALRADGWYLRSEIVWHKTNPMPESVTDRPTKSHELLFLLSKSPKYFYDVEAVKEPVQSTKGNGKSFRGGGSYTGGNSFNNSAEKERETSGNVPNESGLRNRRSVWTIPTRGYSGAHFATYPPDLIKPCILAGSAPGDIVLDVFSGSGTTAGVSLLYGRNAVVFELNPEYAALTPDRVASICGAAP